MKRDVYYLITSHLYIENIYVKCISFIKEILFRLKPCTQQQSLTKHIFEKVEQSLGEANLKNHVHNLVNLL